MDIKELNRRAAIVALSITTAIYRTFYAVIALATLGGVTITFLHFDPVKALYWSAVINGLAAVPIMVVVMAMAASRVVMGQFAFKGLLLWGGWLATVVMAAAAIGCSYLDNRCLTSSTTVRAFSSGCSPAL
jgi:Mn2+/Fe2+ NRAMP family transporter